MRAEPQKYPARCDSAYSPDFPGLGQRWHGTGYHSQMSNGAWVHGTRDSLDYALALLQAGGGENEARATAVIHHVLQYQDTDPFSRIYGIWPWLMEEPLAKMNPPDWNWADFCGARLAQTWCATWPNCRQIRRRRFGVYLGTRRGAYSGETCNSNTPILPSWSAVRLEGLETKPDGNS